MLSTPWNRTSASERAASQAWDYLTDAVGSAGDTVSAVATTAGKRGTRLADEAGSRVSSVADEAWARANAALDALAGRRPGVPWGWVAAAAVAGVAVGFAVAASLRRSREPELIPADPPTTESVHVDAG